MTPWAAVCVGLVSSCAICTNKSETEKKRKQVSIALNTIIIYKRLTIMQFYLFWSKDEKLGNILMDIAHLIVEIIMTLIPLQISLQFC